MAVITTLDAQPNLRVPFSGAYWVIPGKFLAGCHPCFYSPYGCPDLLARIIEAGIRVFVDLTETHERIPGEERSADYASNLEAMADSMNIRLIHRREAIIDRSIPQKAGMSKILDGIDDAIRTAMPVYVHCMGGIGRTGSVVGCYLARHGWAAGTGVIRYIAKLRKHVDFIDLPSPESRPQIEMVKSWGRGE